MRTHEIHTVDSNADGFPGEGKSIVEKHALIEEIASHRSLIRKFLVKILGRQKNVDAEELSEDLVQETLEKAIKSVSQFKGDAKLTTWLSRIAYNTMVSYFRKQKGNVLQFAGSLDEFVGSIEQEVAMEENIEKELLQQGIKLEAALEILNDSERQILELVRMGLSYDKIAQKLKIPPGTVGSRIFGIKTKLKEKFSREELAG